jgi:hypothetical protein
MSHLKRLEDAYEFLVDETENPDTTYNKQRHDRLSDLLELFEYLLGNEEANPLDKWFPAND